MIGRMQALIGGFALFLSGVICGSGGSVEAATFPCPDPPDDWRRYPYTLVPGDAEFIFPAAEGYQGASTDTYYASGILEGEHTGRRYGFLTIFAKNRNVYDILSADIHVVSLFDLDTHVYATMSRFDLPPEYRTNKESLDVTRGRLDVTYSWQHGRNRFSTRRNSAGAPVAFAYALQLRGQDKNGTGMELSLSADATVPPQAVGGCYDYGQLTIYGQPRTHSYYQLLRYSGRLRWGRGESPIDEPVHGQIGWLDRQWFPDYVGTYDGPLADHYGHEWIQLSLSNGWQMALWRQFDRHRQDALVPFSGLTVTDPDGRTVFVDEAGYDIDITTYLRDPGEIEPLLSKPQMLAGIRSPIRYFFDAYRLRVPSLGLDVSSIPMVPAPAHTMPVDYFNGPTQLQGTMAGQPVRGYGFHERTLPLSRPRELLVVLRDSLLHLPPGDVDPPSSPQHLADLAWQAKPLIDEDKRLPAASYLNSRVRPSLRRVSVTERAHLEQIVDDLVRQLFLFPDHDHDVARTP